jgi:hypothetical protein
VEPIRNGIHKLKLGIAKMNMNQCEVVLDRLKADKERFVYAAKCQLQLWNGEKPDRQPLLLGCDVNLDNLAMWPYYNTRETHYHSEKMFLAGLKAVLCAAAGGREAVPSIRANMGCGIFPTLFPGIRQELFDDKMPWIVKHLDKAAITGLNAADLRIGDEFAAGLQHMTYMADQLKDTGCQVFPMDVQGPFDIAHLVYGDAIFLDLFDDPPFVHHLLELSCQAIFLGMQACFEVIPESSLQVAHYNNLVMPRSKGGIKTSEDTATLLSKEHIDEFVIPYLDQVLEHFGGGYIHYCGKNPHLLDAVLQMPLAFGLNLGNPEKHDMVEVLHRCARAGKIYYGAIPKNNDESYEQYFRRLIAASLTGDRSLLLLQYQCSPDDKECVCQAWDQALTS